MKVVMIREDRDIETRLLECPDDLEIHSLWQKYAERWEQDGVAPEPGSFRACHMKLSFIEHLKWHWGCKLLEFEEVGL